MKAKTVLFVLVGMSCSFTVILALLVGLSHQPSAPKRFRRATAQVRAKSDADEVRTPPVRRRAAALSSNEPPPAAAIKAEPVAVKAPPVDAAWEVRQRLLEAELKKSRLDRSDLTRHLSALEQDRGRMVRELAKELSTSEPSQAAEELVALDDETAARVLKKMFGDPRVAVLSLLEPKRARRIQGHIKIL